MPRDCYEELLAPLQEGDVTEIENKEIEYDGKNMEAIVILLNFLYKRFDRVSIHILYTPTKNQLTLSYHRFDHDPFQSKMSKLQMIIFFSHLH